MMANEAELLAGEQALDTYANEEALVYFERGLEGKERQRVDAQTAALLFGLDRAQIATMESHNMQDAIASLSRAFRMSRRESTRSIKGRIPSSLEKL